jgi:hypothetical protein
VNVPREQPRWEDTTDKTREEIAVPIEDVLPNVPDPLSRDPYAEYPRG